MRGSNLARRRGLEINARPWEPPPGMYRVQCTVCLFFYADRNPHGRICPDCIVDQRRVVHGGPLREVKGGR